MEPALHRLPCLRYYRMASCTPSKERSSPRQYAMNPSRMLKRSITKTLRGACTCASPASRSYDTTDQQVSAEGCVRPTVRWPTPARTELHGVIAQPGHHLQRIGRHRQNKTSWHCAEALSIVPHRGVTARRERWHSGAACDAPLERRRRHHAGAMATGDRTFRWASAP
jgi:hypothetical protein